MRSSVFHGPALRASSQTPAAQSWTTLTSIPSAASVPTPLAAATTTNSPAKNATPNPASTISPPGSIPPTTGGSYQLMKPNTQNQLIRRLGTCTATSPTIRLIPLTPQATRLIL